MLEEVKGFTVKIRSRFNNWDHENKGKQWKIHAGFTYH
jgi:hypothetical protein